ncbi:cache domain-containing protein [Methanospirillum stamsii]|nr:cache domain-containing protein [Methanospirillum stamsii]
MNTRCILLILIMFLFYPGCGEELTNESLFDKPSPDEMKPALDTITEQILQMLNEVREENRLSADALVSTGTSGDEAARALSLKLDNITYSHSSLIISPENVVTTAAPEQYASLIGTDLSYQNETMFATEKQSPVVSNIFYLEEGFYGISISYPIFSGEEYLGYTDVTIRPEEFFHPIISPFTEQTGYEVFILQTDGVTVYETSEVETGKNVLTDPLYDTPEMRNVSRAVIDNPEGTIEYSFWNRFWNKQTERQAVWNTLTLDNQEWRIGVVRDINGSADESGTPNEQTGDVNASIAGLTTFVEDATVFAKSTGKQEACDVFNNLSGPFVKEDLYIFGYANDGTTLALPYQQGIVGKNRMDLTDINGLSIFSGIKGAAQRGGDYLYYVYPNPNNDYQYQLKLVFVKPVDDDWFIGSGIYLPWIEAELDPEEINVLVARVKQAVSHAEKVGKEQALDDFNNLDQPYANGGEYIFAYDYNGTTLALPFQPELIGTTRMDYTDQYGAHIIYQEIDAVKQGGGFVYVVYYNPDTGENELKLCYILPAGNDWFVGSGIYTGTNFQ